METIMRVKMTEVLQLLREVKELSLSRSDFSESVSCDIVMMMCDGRVLRIKNIRVRNHSHSHNVRVTVEGKDSALIM